MQLDLGLEIIDSLPVNQYLQSCGPGGGLVDRAADSDPSSIPHGKKKGK